jgi:tRNA/tmRNA/rRNA uracil-C5-methylase (TrmA/RlmC/RlmD family)
MEQAEIDITGLAFGGEGVGRVDGMVCFVPLTAPGDRARVRFTERKKRFLRGELVELLSPSPQRTSPQCPVFGRCGGCQWQHIDYPAQLEAKREHLSQTLRRMAGVRIDPPDLIPSAEIYHYRRSGRLKVDRQRRLGFHRRQSHRIVPIDTCPVFETPLNEHLAVLRRELAGLRRIPSEAELLRREGEPVKHAFLWTGEHSKLGFAQVNAQINAALQEVIAEYLLPRIDAGKEVLDLFCGDGNLSLPLARRDLRVRGFDISRPAVEEARERARAAGLLQAEYSQAPYQELMGQLSEHAGAYGALILDPPRAGLEGKAGAIAALAVPRVVYVSCIPAILARDLLHFLKFGYTIDRVQPLDMFPQTFHLETVVFLSLDVPKEVQ